MAPKKPKKPSSLQRQRQLRAQQQQVKRASSKTLPPGKKGGAVTKPQAAKLKTTPKSAPVEKVRVRDLGPTKPKPLSGASQRALPPGRPGGAVTKPSAKPSAKPSVKPSAKPSGGLRGGLRSAAGLALLSGIASKTTDTLTRAANPKEWERVSQELKDRGYGSKPSPKPAKPAKPEGSVNRRGRPVPAKAKPETKPANVADYKDGQGNTYDGNSGRLKTAAKPKAPAAPPKAPAAPSASPVSKTGSSSGGTSKIHTYKGHGSDLHVGRHKTLAEHRAAVAKAKGGGSASKTARKYNTPDEKSKYVAPNGKPYAGPGYGTPNKKKLKAK